MCGRYRLSRRKQIIQEHFDAVSGEEDWIPRYNVAPTQSIPVIRQNPKEPVREFFKLAADTRIIAPVYRVQSLRKNEAPSVDAMHVG